MSEDSVPEGTDTGDPSEAGIPNGATELPDVVDGVTPTSEVSQDPNLFADDDDAELDIEMED